jgi:hypothetical protein
MKAMRFALCLGAGAGLIVTACQGKETARGPAPAASPAMSAESAAEAVRAVVLKSITFGRSVNLDGAIETPADTFRQGDALFVSFDVSAISPGTEVKLVWYGPADKSEGQEHLVVPAGAKLVNFRARETGDWPEGDHRLQIWIGGASAGSKPFKIAAAGAEGDPSVPR